MIPYLILTTLLIVVDQVTKYLTVQNIALYEIVEVLPDVFSLTHIQNTGAAFSILEGQMWFFYLVSVVVLLFLFYYLYTEGQHQKMLGVILSIVIAGTIGNFIDRLVHQYVIDMLRLEFINFPIFNIADSYLTVGVILLFIYMLYEERNMENE